ncbi:MAG: hypothetical protein QXO69_02450 [archaeon]
MPFRKTVKPTQLEREVKQVEKYEYLLVEYLKEISNEITYLVLIVCSLFLYVMLDLLPAADTASYEIVRIIFILLIIGGFGLFGMSNITKRRIERRFEQMFL